MPHLCGFMSRPAMALAAFVVLLASSSSALAQVRVEGVVRTAGGDPIAGATVRIKWPELKSARTTTTDDQGRYAFADVKAGRYAEIEAFADGRPVRRTVVLVTSWVERVDLRAPPALVAPESAGDLDPMGGPSSELRGVVRSADGRPIAAARIAIHNTTVATITDSGGRYSFGRVRSGMTIELRATAGGFGSATRSIRLPDGSVSSIDFMLEPGVTEAVAAPDSPEDGRSLELRPSQAALIPVIGRQDLFRTVQFLPGTAATLEASSELFVRGGTPGETLVTYDGFTLYPMPHIFGGFTAFNMDAVESARFSESALSPADGGRLSGALRLTGPSAAGSKPAGAVELGGLGWSANGSVPLGRRGAFSLAARGSLPTSLYEDALDWFGAADTHWVRDRLPRFSSGTLETPADSRFYDVNGRLELRPTDRDAVAVSVYEGRDDVNESRDVFLAGSSSIGPPEAVQLPADPVVQVSDVNAWKGRGISAMWDRRWSTSLSTKLSVGRSDFSNSAGRAAILASGSTGTDYSFSGGRRGSAAFEESNRIQDTTVRVESTMRFGFDHAVTAGSEITQLDASYGILREVQVADAGTPASALASLLNRDDAAVLLSFFAQDDWRPWGRLIVSPGIRVSRYDVSGETFVDPKVSSSYSLGPARFRAGFAFDHQVANRITREDLEHGDRTFWALSDGSTIPVARARQVVAGATVEGNGVLFDVQAYYKSLDGLSLFAPRLYPGIAPGDETPLMFEGSGTVRGVGFFLRQHSGANTLWISTTLSRAEYSYPSLEPGAFPASQDQAAELKVVDAFRFARIWSVSGAWIAATPRPETPATGVGAVWFPSGASLTRVVFGSKNSERLPAYHRLDVSTQVDLRARSIPIVLGLTLFNVYDRKNIAYREYEVVGDALGTNDVTLMGRAVNASVRFVF